MLARTIVQPHVLVAVIQCPTMATEVIKVATKSKEDVPFWYSGKKSDVVCGFLVYFCAVLQFSDPLIPPPPPYSAKHFQ